MNAEDKALIARVKERLGRFEASTGRAGLPPDPRDGLRRLLAIVDAQEAEVARLREALALTPERVEAAAKAGYEEWDGIGFEELTESRKNDWRAVGRAALLAAGMQEEALQ